MVEALKNMTLAAMAPLKITFAWVDVMKVIAGPKDTERQQVERDRSLTFLMVDEIGPW